MPYEVSQGTRSREDVEGWPVTQEDSQVGLLQCSIMKPAQEASQDLRLSKLCG